MKLDIRMPMGLMFVIVGLILVGYGALTFQHRDVTRSLGTNINLGWGLVLFFIGVTMVVLARRAMRTEKSNRQTSPVPTAWAERTGEDHLTMPTPL